MKAIRLRTEYLKNPSGIDLGSPRLQWNLEGEGKQAAYEIAAADTAERLSAGDYKWCSGPVISSSMISAVYGAPLKSREQVYWKVRITDEKGQTGEWSDTAFFGMGLLNPEDWQAGWICGDYIPEKGKDYPADEFRKTFTSGVFESAKLYITACGAYETRLNGRRIGEQILTPGSTTCEKRLQYQVYDVSDLLREGRNEWQITLGNGWFRGKQGVFGAKNIYGDITCVKAQLEILLADKTTAVICTDETFEWSADGPIRFNDMKDGESVDAAMIPSYSGKAKRTEWNAVLSCSDNVPVTEHERISPAAVLQTPDGSTVLDFGQNIAGYVEFSVKGSAGHEVTLIMGEMLDEEGNFTQKNLVMGDEPGAFVPDYCDDSRFQQVRYRCGSGEQEKYKSKFCVQGFRYVKLVNWPEPVEKENFTAIAVYSDLEITESFSCSSPDIEKLVENTLWSIKGNYLDVPTDCPTRERAPWLGDAQLFFDTGTFFVDQAAFFRKWIRDIFDDQAENGKLYNIIPRVAPHGGMNDYVEGSSGWTDAGILIPYRYYRKYRDDRLLRCYYPQMKKLAEFLLSRMGDESDPDLDAKLAPSEYRRYIVTSGFHFGEWNEPGSTPMDVAKPKYEEATAYLSYTLRYLAEIAQVLGENKDAEYYSSLSEKTKEAYRFYFVKDGKIDSERMCCYVRPLALGLLTETERKQAMEDLTQLIIRKEYHIGTGFLSTPFVLPVLSEGGCSDLAYTMLEREDYPGWIYEIRQGATTVWENWNGEASRNHYSNGAVCDWIFRYMCGIRPDGENHFIICPEAGGNLSCANASFRSPYGEVKSGWRKEGGQVLYEVEIPAGCTAELRIGGCSEEVASGRYERRV